MATKQISHDQLAKVCTYLNSDRREHQAAHGKWELDTGKLLAALAQAGIVDAAGALLTAERKVLEEFVKDVGDAGGYFRDSKGNPRPFGDPTWIDLAMTYVKACDVLGVPPVEGTEDDAPEYID